RPQALRRPGHGQGQEALHRDRGDRRRLRSHRGGRQERHLRRGRAAPRRDPR
ncbi:hypothetical protein ACJX0J_016726, partial [Zea mays]